MLLRCLVHLSWLLAKTSNHNKEHDLESTTGSLVHETGPYEMNQMMARITANLKAAHFPHKFISCRVVSVLAALLPYACPTSGYYLFSVCL